MFICESLNIHVDIILQGPTTTYIVVDCGRLHEKRIVLCALRIIKANKNFHTCGTVTALISQK